MLNLLAVIITGVKIVKVFRKKKLPIVPISEHWEAKFMDNIFAGIRLKMNVICMVMMLDEEIVGRYEGQTFEADILEGSTMQFRDIGRLGRR